MTSEAAITSLSQLECASIGLLTMRNNVGACLDAQGRMIRYGLMNESEKVNKEFKSSDVIGITPVMIGPQHLGRVLGIFTALEMKASDWKYRPSDEHAKAQQRFISLVQAYGAIAGFVNDPAQIRKIIGGYL